MGKNRFTELLPELSSPDSLLTDLSSHQDYFHDATEFKAVPAAILMAESRADVVAAVRFCRKHSIPITPRGAGTGLSGGGVPSPGALLLSTERINHLQIRPEEKMAVCGPGVITKQLLDAAAPHNLTYPPDPASYDESTLGGNVAEGAGGLRCLRFGVTEDYVIGLEAVMSDGSILKTGILNNYRGFSIGDLLIASEGTLAIITEIVVRLIDTPPVGTTILVAFSDPRHAAQTVSDIISAGMVPSVLEFLDGDTAACSNEYEKTEGLDAVAAILLIETAAENMEAQAEQIRSFCEKNYSSYLRLESDPQKAESLWKVRRNISNAVKEIAPYRVSEDVAVPISRFPHLVDFVAQLNLQSQLRINSFGHAGDGNLHINFLAPSDSADNIALVEQGVELLMKKTLELGGTITGEHGIGLAKRNYLYWEFESPTLNVMRDIKKTFDPENLLNPDKIFSNTPEKVFSVR